MNSLNLIDYNKSWKLNLYNLKSNERDRNEESMS